MAAVDALLVLQARAEARALLYSYCEITLDEALEPLFESVRDSDDFAIGFTIIKHAFAGVAEI